MQGMNAQVHGELAHEIGEFRALAARRTSAASGGQPGQVAALLRTRTQQAVLEHDTVLIGLLGTRVVATSRNYSPATLGVPAGIRASWAARSGQTAGSATLAIGPIRYTVVPVRVPGDPVHGTFVAAVLLRPGEASISRVTQLQLETGGIALLAGTALAWLIAGRVLRPVRDTTDLARQITDTDIAGRIPVRGHNEVTELAKTFNRMLDRLEAALATQRRFLADAGHELRTPIAIVQGNLDTLELGTQDDAETLSIVADELARMSRLVDELTVLASSEQPDFLRCQPVDIGSFTSSVLAKARLLDDRPWLLAGAATGTAVLDPQRLTQALLQLAANAAAHTPAGTAVEISSGLRDGMLEFTVSDRGPGIPVGERGRIFERFARLSTPRTAGTGLGLSIVAAITAAHGGTVQVAGAPGGGAAFVIVLPIVTAATAAVRDDAVTAARTSAESGAVA